MAGIPRRVKYHNPVRTDQVDSQAPGSSWNEEHVNVGIHVEIVDQPLTLLRWRAAIQTCDMERLINGKNSQHTGINPTRVLWHTWTMDTKMVDLLSP